MSMSSSGKVSQCIHVSDVTSVSWEDIRKAQKRQVCDTCEMRATNLWLCLIGQCTYVGCGEMLNDHSSHHAQLDGHCLAINLATERIWCYRCETEVFLAGNNPPFIIQEKSSRPKVDYDDISDNSPRHSAFPGDETESDEEEEGHNVKPRGLTGLSNLGNTDYLNAALQALSNCPPLTRFFLDCPGFIPNKSSLLSKHYMRLMHEMWSKKRPSYMVPNGIVSGIKVVHPMFRGYSQKDTREFLRCFMEQLHEELKQLVIEEQEKEEDGPAIDETQTLPVIDHDRNLSMDSCISSQSDGDYETCDSAIGSETKGNYSSCKKTPQYQSVISDIFDGRLSSSVQCLTCERVSTTKETFQDLSLLILPPSKGYVPMLHSSKHSPGLNGEACREVHQGWLQWMTEWFRSWFLGPTLTLQDCLAAFFSVDELKGDNMYSCERCKKLRNGLKYSRVLTLPEILCIHLKRFRPEFYAAKIGTYVSFPLTSLDMKPYLHKDHSSRVTMYDLVAVICHHSTVRGGYYTAYCQNVFSEQWYKFDDQYVTEVDVSQVVNCEAYVLFYRKQNDHMNGIRQEAMDLMNKREPSLMHFFVSKQWINRFNTFAEPGPITNQDFLCPHGGVPPRKIESIGDLVEPLSQSMWEFLQNKFGGGPSCNHLFPCTVCHKEMEDLRNRQRKEFEEFIQLNEKFKEEDNPSVIYAISMSWFREWENFVRQKVDHPPGPIDNNSISVMKPGGQLGIQTNSDHGQLSSEMWQYLFKIYGGGPELVIKRINPSPTPAKTLAEQALGTSAGSLSSDCGTEKRNSESSGYGSQQTMSKASDMQRNATNRNPSEGRGSVSGE